MPTYRMKCLRHGKTTAEFDWEQSIHDPLVAICPWCSEDVTTQILTPVPVHGVGGGAARRQYANARERDVAAYKRLRKDGVQPRSVTGAAEIETRAGTKHEVETDRVYTDRKLASRVERGIAEVASA